MSIAEIGVRELRQNASRIINDVDTNKVTYRVSIQGHPTNVVISHSPGQPDRRSGATLDQLLSSPLYTLNYGDAPTAELLAIIEHGRNAEMIAEQKTQQ